ncbi:hypothetical protein Avbf_11414 [Armadillidium vulgare]|nr:hypothetical protein Avbf_11414 [Armadillidium vulgare]
MQNFAEQKKYFKLSSRVPNRPSRDNVASDSTPFRNQFVVKLSDVRGSRSIVEREKVFDSVGSATTNDHIISIRPPPPFKVPLENGSPIEFSGLSGRSRIPRRDSVASFSEFSPSISSPVVAKLPSNNLQPPGTITSNLITVPKFDPLPLEDHQPLPKESPKTSAEDTTNNSNTPDDSSTNDEVPPIVFPPTIIFREQEITSDRSPVFLEENLELQLPVTPRGLNSFGFLSGDANSVFPKSIQEIIKEHRPFSSPFLPPAPTQPRNRFRIRRRGIFSWIWPSR